ncbi:MAG: copper transporter [Romboutsia sp.]
MHINMKYYIVTIGAIFIALGIGMLVGFNLNYDQELSKQQAVIIGDLDTKFEDLKNTNDTLEENLANITTEYDKVIEFINQNIDKIIVNELQEKNIGIISINGNSDTTKGIEEIITKANGSIAFDIILNRSIYDESKFEELSTKLNLEIKNTQEIVNYVVETLKDENASEKLANLQELGLIKVNTLNSSYINYDSVILEGGNDSINGKEEFEKVEKVLISKLKEEKYLIGVQKSDAKFSYVELYAKDKVTTIDNIDEGVGKLSLVTSLKESISAQNFGRLESANSLLPYKK